MHISTIDHTLRGLHFSGALTSKVIITGPSASGKTSIMDAIALALTGSVPRLGSSGAKLEPVINGTKASCRLGLSDGTSRTFDITKGAKGQISKKSSSKESLSPIIIDASLFTGAKPADRIAMIQSAVGHKGNLLQTLAKVIFDTGISTGLISHSKDPGEWIAETTDLLKTEDREQGDIYDRLTAVVQTVAIESAGDVPIYDAKAHAQATASHREALLKSGQLQAEIENLERTLGAGEPVKPTQERRADIQDASEHLNNLRLKKSQMSQAISIAESNKKKIAGWQSQSAGVCSVCGSSHEHWSSEVQASRKSELEKIKGYIAAAEKLIAACSTDDEYDDLEASINDAEQEARLQYEWQAYNYAKAAYDTARSSLSAKEGAHLGLAKVIETLEAEIALYKQNELAAAAAQSEVAASARRKAEREMANERSNKAKAALKALKDEVNNQSNKLMGPILKIANTITKGILPAPVEASNFALGYSRDGAWVPLDGFSGAETAVALSSIQAALLSENDIKTIIVDEAQKLDPVMFVNFLHNLEKSIEKGDIEQAIIIGSNLDNFIPDGWQSIILTK